MRGFEPGCLPRPGFTARVDLGRERWLERARQLEDESLSAFARQLAEDESGRVLLDAIFGNSPFLSNCLLAEIGLTQALVTRGVDLVIPDLLAGLNQEIASEHDTNRVMQALRIGRRRMALAVALADLAQLWPLERVTRALSDFADACIGLASVHLLRRAAEAGDIDLPFPDAPAHESGLVIIGMGKLGARELNYSSDIDLIILYDPDKVAYRGSRSVQDFFVRLARDLVRILQERTDSGYVFRTDLRLRPDPASTPLAMSVNAAETYYEGMGQNWERAAMIKARAVAGDLNAGQVFLAHLRPFVWRKSLDFAAIQDIHSIKRQIHAVKGHRDIAVAGHNIKLGRGGIREIEFFAQTQQLIWGGRHPDLRRPDTCSAIRALVAMDRTAPETANELIDAYRFLRKVEHRLQMIDDRQTQTLPQDGPDLDALACFLGFDSTEAFARELMRHLGNVEDHYAELFEEAPSLGDKGNLVFTGIDPDPETVRTLERMGFGDGGSVWNVVRGWHHGRYRAMRSTRARELLTEIKPRLLEALAATANPDAAFARFDEFLGRLPGGVQLFSLLHANPGLLDLLAEIMGNAPRLAEHLSRNASLLDAVLGRGFFDALPARAALAGELGIQLQSASDLQDALDTVRRWTKDRQFQVGVRILRNMSHGGESGAALSDVADAGIAALQPYVISDFARLHGRLRDAGMVTIGLGKLGSREMTVTSDLDLIFIYDMITEEADPEALTTALSDGEKPLAPMQYFARLAQRMINAITAPTGEGKLFEVDMRLRPSGNQGPIASSLSGFLRYQEESAWTWEHLALTRARVIAGPGDLARRVSDGLRRILCRPREPGKLAKDVLEMRARIAETYPGRRLWDLKYMAGGMLDLEFIAQFLQLRHAAEHPEILHPTTAEGLRRAATAGLLDAALANDLTAAGALWQRLLGLLRLTLGARVDPDSLSDGLKRSLAAAAGVDDFQALDDHILANAKRVRAAFEAIIRP